MKRQANVPRMMIMNAAGLFSELIGAPLRIMPPKIAMSPDNSPISVDFSKKIPLFPNGRDARRLLQRRLPTCIQHPQTMQMISAASSSLLAAESIGLFEHLGHPFSRTKLARPIPGHDRRNFMAKVQSTIHCLIYIETNAKKIHDWLKDFATIFL